MRLAATTMFALLLTTAASGQGKNLLFYGNSYTFLVWGYGVPEVVEWIAIEAGHPAPNVTQALMGGSTLNFHANDPGQIAAIATLPAGQSWDHVVIQGHSLQATPYFGYTVQQFRSDALTIAGNVRAHSPNAGAVLYQTWARAHGSMYYPSPWPDPMAMHQMVRGNYDLAVADINAAFGPGTARKAAVGDAIALLEWDPVWYDPDLSHPGPAMSMMAGMCIYTSIYGGRVCDVAVDWNNPQSPLVAGLQSQGIGEATWNLFAGIADRSAVPANRRYPGSGDHLLLESGIDGGAPRACPHVPVTAGTQVALSLRSMNGVYDQASGWLVADFFATNAAPGPHPVWPEFQVDPTRVAITPPLALAQPYLLSFTMPLTLPGYSLLV
ncbi:MAG: hypothetical protein KAI24_15835, partial [Planctomycetes bacterium]|nr:hypothetical protein [Planctomycetota bacterium]